VSGEEDKSYTYEGEIPLRVSTSVDALLVERLKEVGIPPDEFPKLQDYVGAWKERGLTDGEAWPLVMSVEMWAQGRRMVAQGKRALQIAVCALVISAIAGLGSLLLSIYQTFCLPTQ